MSLKENLLQDMKEAMKAKESGKTALSVIRMIRSAIRNTEIDNKIELDDTGVGVIIAKEMKQRQESLEEFNKAGRNDLVEQTTAEMDILKKYMPRQLTSDELHQIVMDALVGKDMISLKMGDVMKIVMPLVKGKADGRMVSQAVKDILQKNS
ncbi:MAG: GatB/YqeY domain-containing protein [Megasphaera sp.]|jgi:uncharacterized protein YqeY|uniref:GatB/YqeY domain-containing protein n=1 Tax=Megasphaera sueciensis TaxID=349094 RepID=UPI003D05AE16|nr:GatB/YqeY domain-containing protein [Megasphaera sp.]MCI1823125.1 GatB/YqeY domain-containing protein [Megasphaera sp.]